MEKRGWVKGQWEQAASGRERRYYRLTLKGRKQLAPLRAEWNLFFRALHRLAGVSHAG
jgi:PadR family transcriptional regulator, regulatory protein PadR